MQVQDTEVWLPIPETNGVYEASNHGRIRSLPQESQGPGRRFGRVLSLYKDTKGYQIIRLYAGRKVMRKVHRIIALVFIGPCPDGMQVNHKDGNKENNRPENLEYVTCKENVRHSWETGLHESRKGQSHPYAKLNEGQVNAIRKAHPAKSMSELGREYGVTMQTINLIVKRKTWTHI